MPSVYLDASALVKLVVREDESEALDEFLAADARLVASELVLAETPRATARASARRSPARRAAVRARTEALLAGLVLVEIDRRLLSSSADIDPPPLRTLDAIHVATALSIPELGVFVTYDRRQAEAAQRAGLPVVAPR